MQAKPSKCFSKLTKMYMPRLDAGNIWDDKI